MKATIPDSLEESKYKRVTDLNPEEEIAPGSALCAGCGGLEGIRLAMKVLGENTLTCNAAGCFTLISIYPFTPLKGSWLYTTMSGPVPAAQGVRDALDIRMQKHGLPKTEDLQVLVVAGDGSTNDMGLSPTSAAIHRNLDFIYFCYDNEAYGNTGFQHSGASPLGSYTMTSPSTQEHPAGSEQTKKDLFGIWMAHNPPYLATVSPREPIDLSNKFKKAKGMGVRSAGHASDRQAGGGYRYLSDQRVCGWQSHSYETATQTTTGRKISGTAKTVPAPVYPETARRHHRADSKKRGCLLGAVR
jgi:pyruvate ferredoxin oxidoreductase beta subunit